MNIRELENAAQQADALATGLRPSLNNNNLFNNSKYLRSAKFNRLNYRKSPTTLTMTCSDSDSDQEYPRRWIDRLEDGESLKIYIDLFFRIFIKKKII